MYTGRKKIWESKCTEKDQHIADELNEAMKDLVHEAKQQEHDLGRIQSKEIRNLTHCLKDNRGLGCDHWAPLEWQALPDEGIDALRDLIETIEQRVAMPIQVLNNIVALIPKPKGGDRPICLASLIYVLWTALRGDLFKDWDAGRAEFWDDAVQKSSALKAALKRRMLDEAEVETGGYVISTMWDLEKFYDSIRPGKLIRTMLAQGVRPRLLALAMQVHLAPRFLKHAGAFS